MKITHVDNVDQKTVELPGASGCRVRWVLGKDEGAPNFAMRQFEVDPDGFTPRHFHPYEHEVYVIDGTGVVYEGDVQHPIGPGDVVFVQPDEVHQFRNTGDKPLKFLCLIPNSAADLPVTLAPEYNG